MQGLRLLTVTVTGTQAGRGPGSGYIATDSDPKALAATESGPWPGIVTLRRAPQAGWPSQRPPPAAGQAPALGPMTQPENLKLPTGRLSSWSRSLRGPCQHCRSSGIMMPGPESLPTQT